MFSFFKKNSEPELQSDLPNPEIKTSLIKAGYNSSMSFNIAIGYVINWVRIEVDTLSKSKNDPAALGAIHALAKLCKNEKCEHLTDFDLYDSEIDSWKESFEKWATRKNSSKLTELIKEAKQDFETLYKASKHGSPEKWQKKASKRPLIIMFESLEKLNQAKKAAETKFPVKLGSAIHKHLKEYIEELTTENSKLPQKENNIKKINTETLETKVYKSNEDIIYLSLDCFEVFEDEDSIENDEIMNAYDLEQGIKSYLVQYDSELLNHLDFDCESSMFLISSKNFSSINRINEVLFKFYEDSTLVKQFIKIQPPC